MAVLSKVSCWGFKNDTDSSVTRKQKMWQLTDLGIPKIKKNPAEWFFIQEKIFLIIFNSTGSGDFLLLTLKFPNQINNSPYSQPYNSYSVGSKNLVLDQLITPK